MADHFSKPVLEVKLMEAWQGREQQHRQVSGTMTSVCLQRHRSTQGRGGSSPDSTGGCAV